ncbi:MAG: hypothetical protein PVJ15_03000 [Gammaproteobacteria bacterium]|jgi:hypothetical protein
MNYPLIYHELQPQHLSQFLQRGYRRKYVFAHRTYHIPKPAPDAVRLAHWMLDEPRGVKFWTVTLHATGESLSGLPPDLFFNYDLVIHRQQFGIPGHIAFANLAGTGRRLHVLQMVGDPVQRRQRAGRHREHLRNRFRGWRYLLVNSVLDFALNQGYTRVYFPRAELVMRFTGKRKPASNAFLIRLYDQTPAEHFEVTGDDDWWRLDLHSNRHRVIELEKRQQRLEHVRTICITHDIEHGIGHRTVDPEFARAIDRSAPGWLAGMLDAERVAGCKSTYCVVGKILSEVRDDIEQDGHCLAFHSYDHVRENMSLWQRLPLRYLRIHLFSRLRGYPPAVQLKLCRQIDYQLRGYRPPNSILSRELHPDNLRYFNFDWLASSSDSLGIREPRFHDGIAYLPIQFDDFPLYRGDCSYAEWEARALAVIEGSEYIAFGLHDCYAAHWLPHYRRFLDQLMSLGEVTTLEAVANELFLAQCR